MDTIQEYQLALQNKSEKISSVVKRLGNPVSTILLNSPCQIFSIPEVDGLIGYQKHGNCVVVLGDPVCEAADLPILTKAFHLDCQEKKWSVVYLMATEFFAEWAITNCCQTLIQVGEELILNPLTFKIRQKLRWKINQSIQHGVVIKEYRDDDSALEAEMRRTIDAWLGAKHGPQIYVGTLDILPKGADRRIFYATWNNEIVGLLAISRIDQFHGWVVSSYFSLIEAPVGVTENLMYTTVDTLAKEGCNFLCLGAISGSKLGKMIGLNPFSKLLAQMIFGISKWFFHFDTRKIYFNKYHPSCLPTFVLCSNKIGINELLALKNVIQH